MEEWSSKLTSLLWHLFTMKTLLKVSVFVSLLPLWKKNFKPLYWKVGQNRKYKLINLSVWAGVFPIGTYSTKNNPKTKCEAFGFQMLRTLNTMIQNAET